jgi:hypothetical protein
MAAPKKLTRADVYKQIDAFRGVAQTAANGKPSAEQWVANRRTEPVSPLRQTKRKKP